MQKKTERLSVFIISTSLACLTGCAGMSGGRTPTTMTSMPPPSSRAWSGAKARVAVIEFDDKTGVDYQITTSAKGTRIGTPMGNGMREQLVTALMQTGQFEVLERSNIKDVLMEQDFGASGRVKRKTAAAVGEVRGAEFLVYGAVTEYMPSQASMSAGTGVDPIFGAFGAGAGGAIASLAARTMAGAMTASQDHVAIDIRLVDARTGTVVNATSVEGTPQDYGAGLGGIFGNVLLGTSMQVQTPIQKAVRACMIKAVNWIGDEVQNRRTQTPEVIEAAGEEGTPVVKKSRGNSGKKAGRSGGRGKKGSGGAATGKSGDSSGEWGE